jgi:hypothetical protein
VYVSDSGVKPGKNGFDPTGTDAVFSISKDKKEVQKIAKAKDLNRPNGLALMAGNLWVVALGGDELYRVTADGKKLDAQKMAKGTLDGLVALDDGSLLVSSWDGSSVYHGKPGGAFKAVAEGIKSPAGIGYDPKRHRVLIPSFQGDAVEARELAGVSAGLAPAAPLAPATPTKVADPKAQTAAANKAASTAAASAPAPATSGTAAPTTKK